MLSLSASSTGAATPSFLRATPTLLCPQFVVCRSPTMVGAALRPSRTTNIVLGGYDGSLAGLTLRPDETTALTLTLSYAYAPHANAIRSTALSGPTLVTGSADETIRVYDLARKVEVGTLLHHDGTINALEFTNDGRDILFSGSDDATICVWRCSDWACLKRLTGHQSPVLDLSIHPSARVALSTSKDRTLFMWDLVKGKIVFSAKTKGAPASSVRWSPDGRHYLLAAGGTVTLSNVEGRSLQTFSGDRDVLCNAFLDESKIAIGGEEKVVRLWDTREAKKSSVLFEHGARVKDLSVVDEMLISADSQGGIKVWDARMQGQPRIETQVGRGNLLLTCMAAECAEKVVVQSERKEETKDVEEGSKHSRRASKRKEGGSQSKASDEAPKRLEGTASQRKRKKRKIPAK